MRAIVFHQAGPPSVLKLRNDAIEPRLGYGQVKVKVFATSVNPIDHKVRSGTYLPYTLKTPHIPGADVAGVVTECASARSRFTPGDRVYGMPETFYPSVTHGTYAEYICVDEEVLCRMPDSMSFQDAAALPLVTLTAWQALLAARVTAGQRILIHAGSGGVGSMAIQIAKAWGAYVVTTCSAGKYTFVKSLGADECVDYHKDKFEEVYAHDPFDVIVDLIGGPYEARSLKVLKKDGCFQHIMNQGWLPKVGKYADTPVEAFFILKGMLWQLIGWGPRYEVTIVKPNSSQLEIIGRLLTEGKLKAVIDKAAPLDQAQQAHEYVEKGHAKGKVVLTVAR
ncbi:hypothetical protein ABBQ38_002422 [Trebouxia sp. C0009 RCD-2024]